MTKSSRDRRGKKSAAQDTEQTLNISLYSNSDDRHHHFCVPAQITVTAFLELALERLSQGEGAERVQALMRYYEPVLELHCTEDNRELPGDKTLIEAGLCDHAVCRIAARPRKERIMFCNTDYS